MNTELMEEYARLLRLAWLNPSYGPVQRAVYEFEHKHLEKLDALWIKWQKLNQIY
jgi:hypothetical protein